MGKKGWHTPRVVLKKSSFSPFKHLVGSLLGLFSTFVFHTQIYLINLVNILREFESVLRRKQFTNILTKYHLHLISLQLRNTFHFHTILLLRRGIDPCQRVREPDNKKVDQDYENPNIPEKADGTEDDVYDQYMELEEPKFAGYVNQMSK